MQTIRATEARANFAALLRKAADGKERIIIERRGNPRRGDGPFGPRTWHLGRPE